MPRRNNGKGGTYKRETKLPDADGRIIFYEKCALREIPTFEEGEGRVFEKCSDLGGSERTFIDLTGAGYAGEEVLSKKEAVRLARASGKEIEYDDQLMVSSFILNRYRRGKREEIRVAFESAENIKAKLELVCELGFMGISFDIGRVCMPDLILAASMFDVISYPVMMPKMENQEI